MTTSRQQRATLQALADDLARDCPRAARALVRTRTVRMRWVAGVGLLGAAMVLMWVPGFVAACVALAAALAGAAALWPLVE